MVVFYDKATTNVLGYAMYNSDLAIVGTEIRSSTFNRTDVDWNVIGYGFYKYEIIPPERFTVIGGGIVPIAWKLNELNLEPIEPEDLPHSQHIAQLTGVDVSRSKPLEVTRRFHGVEYTENCFVSQSVIAMYLNSQIQIGDYVIVSYISETPNQEAYELPIVVDKVYQSWE